MIIAMAVWNGRVSPLFDTSRRIEVFDVEDGKYISRGEIEVVETEPFAKVEWLSGLRLDTIICGAVSRPLAGMITARGIKLIPFVAGEKGEVLAAFLSGSLSDRRLVMPGCCCGRMRMRGRGRGIGGN